MTFLLLLMFAALAVLFGWLIVVCLFKGEFTYALFFSAMAVAVPSGIYFSLAFLAMAVSPLKGGYDLGPSATKAFFIFAASAFTMVYLVKTGKFK